MSDKLKVKVQWPDWAGRLKKAEDRINRFIAADIQTNRGMMFDQEGAWNGHEKWAPLKYREGQILSLTGTLRKSISPSRNGKNAVGIAGPNGFVEQSGDLVKKTTKVGTRLAYAAMMNWGTSGLPGGVLVPKKADALRFKVNGNWVFAKSVTIPARHFDEWNEEDAKELEVGLTNLVADILNGK